MMFLRNLADYLRERHLAQDAQGVMLFGGGVWGMAIALSLLGLAAGVLGILGGIVSLVLGLGLLAAGIIFLVRYIRLLLAARDAVA
jgi:hypothetical protein